MQVTFYSARTPLSGWGVISLREARHVLNAHTACEQEKKKQPRLTRAHIVPSVVHCPTDHSVILLIRKDVEVLREEIHHQLKSSE